MNAQDMSNLVKEFMDNFDQPCYPSAESTPCAVAVLRGNLIEEETKELVRAPAYSAEELDAICDLLYVTLGTNLALGIPVRVPLFNHPAPTKEQFYQLIKPCVQDLYCKFPCTKTQTTELNKITACCFILANNYNYNLASAFRAVHESNMSKLWKDNALARAAQKPGFTATMKPKGWLVKDSRGKVVKPEHFSPPDLTPYIP